MPDFRPVFSADLPFGAYQPQRRGRATYTDRFGCNPLAAVVCEWWVQAALEAGQEPSDGVRNGADTLLAIQLCQLVPTARRAFPTLVEFLLDVGKLPAVFLAFPTSAFRQKILDVFKLPSN